MPSMDSLMPPSVVAWAREPSMQTLAVVVIGLALIVVATRALRLTLATYVSDNTARYQTRKLAGPSLATLSRSSSSP